MRGALWIVVAALAGCAGEPEPLVPLEGTYSDYDGPLPGTPLAPLTWQVFHEAGATITPATPVSVDVQVPNGTIQALVNVTMRAGGGYALHVRLSDCVWSRDIPIVGNGQTFGADCGGASDGASRLTIETTAGAIDAHVIVGALVCDVTKGRCPPRLPATGAEG